MRSLTRSLAYASLAFGLVVASPSIAAESHAHGGTATVKLRLDQGKKWPTDDALRRGMSEIRLAMAQSLTPIHNNALTPAQYDALIAYRARLLQRRSFARAVDEARRFRHYFPLGAPDRD